MVAGADRIGPGITAAGDSRITRIGRFLRSWKLDELPQLWNVLRGDMSLVGPRPELPVYVKDYNQEQREVLSHRPGLTDLASIEFRNEEELLAAAPDREQFYRQVVLPHKLALGRRYVENISFKGDCLLLFRTASAIASFRRQTRPLGADNRNAEVLGQGSSKVEIEKT
jgi:lipopolysaccharide/colanic/teichoic acid biosynthesis glycosyltransferase